MKKLVNGELVDLTTEEIAAREAEAAASLAASKIPALLAYERAKRDGGITVGGIFVATGETDRSLINGAVTRALLDNNDTLTYPYYPTGGGTVSLMNAQYKAIGQAIAAHVQKCLDASEAVFADIENYDTISEIQGAFDAAYNG